MRSNALGTYFIPGVDREGNVIRNKLEGKEPDNQEMKWKKEGGEGGKSQTNKTDPQKRSLEEGEWFEWSGYKFKI